MPRCATAYDIILIDSAPGLSVLTECWLREADFYLSPAKPDYLSTHALQFLQQFEQRDAQMGFSESLGVVISMKDAHSPEDEQFDRWLRHNIKNRCFEQAIPRASALQTAAYFSVRRRSYWAKYPGQTGKILRGLAAELLERLAAAEARGGRDAAPGDAERAAGEQDAVSGAARGGSIGQRGLDGGELGLGVGVGLVGLAGAAVPVARVAGVALDLVQHGVDPAGGGVGLVLLHDLVRRVPVAGDGQARTASGSALGDFRARSAMLSHPPFARNSQAGHWPQP